MSGSWGHIPTSSTYSLCALPSPHTHCNEVKPVSNITRSQVTGEVGSKCICWKYDRAIKNICKQLHKLLNISQVHSGTV